MAVAATPEDIGRLAALAAVRTALNYLLGQDLNEFREAQIDAHARQA